MTKNQPIPAAQLNALRDSIDTIDQQIVQLLKDRIKIVEQVGDLKNHYAPGTCPIRPAREAAMMRNIVSQFEDSKFEAAAAAAMWRTLIGACINVESPLTVSVYTQEKDRDLFWLAREYYGPYITFTRQPHIKRVIGDVMDGKASVGVVPMLHGDDSTYWWTNLLQEGDDVPKIFAHIPFISAPTFGRNDPSGLAIGKIPLEPSGDDCSLIVLEAGADVSHSKLQNAMLQAGIQASWINIATLHPEVRHHLILLKGFYTEEDPTLKSVLSTLGNSVERASFLGAFATPCELGASKETISTGQLQHATATNAV